MSLLPTYHPPFSTRTASCIHSPSSLLSSSVLPTPPSPLRSVHPSSTLRRPRARGSPGIPPPDVAPLRLLLSHLTALPRPRRAPCVLGGDGPAERRSSRAPHRLRRGRVRLPSLLRVRARSVALAATPALAPLPPSAFSPSACSVYRPPMHTHVTNTSHTLSAMFTVSFVRRLRLHRYGSVTWLGIEVGPPLVRLMPPAPRSSPLPRSGWKHALALQSSRVELVEG
ncbi:hypothetical protein C8Q77DRAFT_382768 [Trametes polyzona]|nr:hypothetical protein C8Q77DRAFT_382768 [Trametes polyzona]